MAQCHGVLQLAADAVRMPLLAAARLGLLDAYRAGHRRADYEGTSRGGGPGITTSRSSPRRTSRLHSITSPH